MAVQKNDELPPSAKENQPEPKLKKSRSDFSGRFGLVSLESRSDSRDRGVNFGANGLLWTKKYKPKLQKELAVNGKRIAQVRGWLENVQGSKRGSGILFLTGPSGCCKRTTVDVLAENLGLEVIRLRDLSSIGGHQFSTSLGCEEMRSISFEFREFLRDSSRSNTYPLDSTSGLKSGNGYNRGRFILIEDLPNMNIPEIRNTVQNELNLYLTSRRSIVPIVIILTDSTNTPPGVGPESSYAKYYTVKGLVKNFHNETIRSLVQSLQFLPLTSQLVRKALKRIAVLEFGPSKNNPMQERVSIYIENIINSCVKDLRHAINTLQFYCVSNLCGNYINTNITTKDVLKSVYSAAGNILYNKFTNKNQKPNTLPIDINYIIDNICIDSNSFIFFLHQNYVSFFRDIADIGKAAEYFSCADLFSINRYSGDLYPYYLSVSSRALVVCNKSPSPNEYRKLLFSEFLKVTYKEKSLKYDLDSFTRCIGTSLDIKYCHDILRKSIILVDIIPLCKKIWDAHELPITEKDNMYDNLDEHPSDILASMLLKVNKRTPRDHLMSRQWLKCYTGDDIEEC